MTHYLGKRRRVKPILAYPVVILYDDREKRPWKFNSSYFKTERVRLKVGDYTIKGYQNTIAIEKKSGLKEFLANLSGHNRSGFMRQLAKLSSHTHSFLVINDDPSRVAEVLETIPNTRLTMSSVSYWITYITVNLGVPVLFTGKDRSLCKLFVHHLLTNIIEKINKGEIKNGV